MSTEPAEDHVQLLPPITVGGREIALEIEVVGAWVDGTYISLGEIRHPTDQEHRAVAEAASEALRKVREAVIAARKAREGTG